MFLQVIDYNRFMVENREYNSAEDITTDSLTIL